MVTILIESDTLLAYESRRMFNNRIPTESRSSSSKMQHATRNKGQQDSCGDNIKPNLIKSPDSVFRHLFIGRISIRIFFMSHNCMQM